MPRNWRDRNDDSAWGPVPVVALVLGVEVALFWALGVGQHWWGWWPW